MTPLQDFIGVFLCTYFFTIEEETIYCYISIVISFIAIFWRFFQICFLQHKISNQSLTDNITENFDSSESEELEVEYAASPSYAVESGNQVFRLITLTVKIKERINFDVSSYRKMLFLDFGEESLAEEKRMPEATLEMTERQE